MGQPMPIYMIQTPLESSVEYAQERDLSSYTAAAYSYYFTTLLLALL